MLDLQEVDCSEELHFKVKVDKDQRRTYQYMTLNSPDLNVASIRTDVGI